MSECLLRCLRFFILMHGLKCQLNVITDDTPLAERGPCISNPCLHNGLCTITRSGFICTCVDGYIGVMCERRSDDCPYDNFLECGHGRCKLDMNGRPRCICNDGYEGPSCTAIADGCYTKPCLNGGTCIDKGNYYECLCSARMGGTHCQINEDAMNKCLSSDKQGLGGKYWHETVENITVSWGYGDLICNSKRTCFDTVPADENQHDYMEVQLKPVTMQYTDSLIFITHSEYSLKSNQFQPHILPMETSSESAFLSCNISKGRPITDKNDVIQLKVNGSFLNLGTQYFLADINTLYRCVFGLRLNVTVKSKDCSEKEDDPSYCNGHGRCFSDFNRKNYECICCEGYVGKYCQYEDPCLIKPCANNGTCNMIDYGDGILKHYCSCADGYRGEDCGEEFDPCSSNTCQNEAVCQTTSIGYRCDCKPGFSGTYCEINEDGCSRITCQNGGTCFDGLNSFFCKCMEGFKGTLCEIETNECENSPCTDGTCIDLLQNYTCACKAGHVGRNCEVTLKECASQDCVNGKCVEDLGGDSCNCGIGYTGILCEVKLDLCEFSKFCEKANAKSCHDHGTNVTCVCQDGWTGSNCGVNINDCANAKCMHNGSCVDKLNGYECKCRAGYSGKMCEDIEFKLAADIEIVFHAVNCRTLKTGKGIQYLEKHIIDHIESSCKCSFSTQSIIPKTSRVACKDDNTGVFMTDIKEEKDEQYLRRLVCSLLSSLKDVEKDIYISDEIYIVSIADDKGVCPIASAVATNDDYSQSGVIAGVIIGILIVIASVILVSLKVRKIRRKIGVTQTPQKDVFSFDNSMFKKTAILKEESTDETSFTSSDPHDLPKWSEGYNRSGNIYERNKRSSQTKRSFNSNGQPDVHGRL